MRTEDEYFDLVTKLSDRLTSDTPDDRLRQLARKEAETVVARWLIAGAVLYAGKQLADKFGFDVLWAWFGIAIGWILWTSIRAEFDPLEDRHLVVSQAEDLNRLTILRECQAAGEPCWQVSQPTYSGEKVRITPIESSRWDQSWKRIYTSALELEKLSPRKRKKRLLEAAVEVEPALRQGSDMAAAQNAELIYWARAALEQVRRR